MRAVVHDRYGPPDVLRLDEVDRPVPREDEVLVRVCATTVNRRDLPPPRRRSGHVAVVRGPAPTQAADPGQRTGRVVEAAGRAVTRCAAGDQVFGLNPWLLGAHAESVCVSARGLIAHKPVGLSFAHAAAVCDGGLNALACLRRARVQSA